MLACSYNKTGIFNPEYSRIRILKFEESGVDAPIFCQQCEKPQCVDACPQHALSKNPVTGMVDHNDTLCNGCGICVMACPYGAVSAVPSNRAKGRAVLKCDLCGGERECVKWCEIQAIRYVDIEDEAEKQKTSQEDMILAKKRFEIEHRSPIWKYYLKKPVTSNPADSR